MSLSKIHRLVILMGFATVAGIAQAPKAVAQPQSSVKAFHPTGPVTVTPCSNVPGTPFESISYSWDPNGVLTIRHENAYLNCCLIGVSVQVVQSGENLHFDEVEKIAPDGGLCGCSCYYTLEYTISGLTPGIYTFSFNQHPLYKLLPSLLAKVDLRQFNRGVIQVERFKPAKQGVQ